MASITVKSPDGKVRAVNLRKRITSIGRSDDNDIKLEDLNVPEHAIHIMFDGSRYQVGSHGGAFQVNGKKKDEHVLGPSDVIRLGESELTFGAGTFVLTNQASCPRIM